MASREERARIQASTCNIAGARSGIRKKDKAVQSGKKKKGGGDILQPFFGQYYTSIDARTVQPVPSGSSRPSLLNGPTYVPLRSIIIELFNDFAHGLERSPCTFLRIAISFCARSRPFLQLQPRNRYQLVALNKGYTPAFETRA